MRYTIKKFCIDTTRIIYLIINLNLARLNDKHNKKLFFKQYDKIIFTLDFFYLRFLIYYSNLIYFPANVFGQSLGQGQYGENWRSAR